MQCFATHPMDLLLIFAIWYSVYSSSVYTTWIASKAFALVPHSRKFSDQFAIRSINKVCKDEYEFHRSIDRFILRILRYAIAA